MSKIVLGSTQFKPVEFQDFKPRQELAVPSVGAPHFFDEYSEGEKESDAKKASPSALRSPISVSPILKNLIRESVPIPDVLVKLICEYASEPVGLIDPAKIKPWITYPGEYGDKDNALLYTGDFLVVRGPTAREVSSITLSTGGVKQLNIYLDDKGGAIDPPMIPSLCSLAESRIAVTFKKSVRIFDLQKNQWIHLLALDDKDKELRSSPDGQHFACYSSDSGIVYVCDTKSPEALAEFPCNNSCFDFLGADCIAVRTDRALDIWDFRTKKKVDSITKFEWLSGRAMPDGCMLGFGTVFRGVQIFDPAKEWAIKWTYAHDEDFNDIRVLPSGQLAFFTNQGVCLVTLENSNGFKKSPINAKKVKSLIALPGNVLALVTKGQLQIWG